MSLWDALGEGPTATSSRGTDSSSTGQQQTGTQTSGATGQTGATTSQSNIADWARPYAQDALAMGRGVSQQQFNRFDPGSGVADLSSNEQQAMGRAGGTLDAISPFVGRSAQMTEQASGPFSLSSISQHMNPYVTEALDPAARKINEAAMDDRYNISSKARQLGAFGGSRQGILEDQAEENRLESLSDLYKTGLSDAYGQATSSALQAHGMDQQGALAGAGQYGSLGQMVGGTYGQDVDQLMGTGGAERGVRQREADIGRQEHLREQGWGSDRLNDYLSAVSGTPMDRSQTTQSQQQTSNLSEVMQMMNTAKQGTERGFGSETSQSSDIGTLGGLAGLAASIAGIFSDENMKKNKRKMSGKEVLAALDEVNPGQEWEYKHRPGEKRIGPMAQDMKEHMGVGTGRTLPPNEMASLSLAAVQELSDKVDKLGKRG